VAEPFNPDGDPSQSGGFRVEPDGDGTFSVIGPDGRARMTRRSESSAIDNAEKMNRGAGAAPPNPPPADGDRYQVIPDPNGVTQHVVDSTSGYSIQRSFGTKESAERHAESLNRPVAPTPPKPPSPTAGPVAPPAPFPTSSPTPSPTPPASPTSFPSSMSPQSWARPRPPAAPVPVATAPVGFPSSMFPAAPVSAPSRWSGAWPTGMVPPQMPRGGFPSAMFGATPPAPRGPIGPSGFPAAMYASPLPVAGPMPRPFGWQPAPPSPPTPPAPGTHGFVGPMPQTNRDLVDAIGAAVAHATSGLPHANGGKFDWTKIGEGLAKGLETTGGSSRTSGLPSVAIEWSGVGSTIAKGFARELKVAGGFVEFARGMGRYAEAANEANRGRSQYNGGLASAFNQLDFGEFQRNFRITQATAASAIRLAENVNAGRDAWVPVEILAANVQNRLAIAGAQVSRIQGNVIGMGANLLNAAIEAVDPGGVNTDIAGRALGVLNIAGQGAAVGFGLGGPKGGLIGGAVGLGVGIVADQQKNQPVKEDPWGEFLKNANVMPRLPARPAKLVDFTRP
jgi:hypothetical protein